MGTINTVYGTKIVATEKGYRAPRRRVRTIIIRRSR